MEPDHPQPDKGDLSEEGTRELLRLKLSETDRERVQELSAKANDGMLTSVEGEVLDRYLKVGQVLDFLKAKARISLKKHIT